MRKVVERDGLTGLDSRGHFMQRARDLLQRSQFDRSPFSLFMIDVDHFKAINDTWGHNLIQQADRALHAGKHAGRNQVVTSREAGDEA